MPAAEAPFLVGTAISVWQNSGGGPSNWDTWCNKKTLFGGSPIMGGDKVQVSRSSRPYQAFLLSPQALLAQRRTRLVIGSQCTCQSHPAESQCMVSAEFAMP